jgi:hypothetical protein
MGRPEAELTADLGGVGDALPGIVECPARRLLGDRLAVGVQQFQRGDGCVTEPMSQEVRTARLP